MLWPILPKPEAQFPSRLVPAESPGHHELEQAGVLQRLDDFLRNAALGFSPRGVLLQQGPQFRGTPDEFLFLVHI
jgi:hypothetical protein